MNVIKYIKKGDQYYYVVVIVVIFFIIIIKGNQFTNDFEFMNKFIIEKIRFVGDETKFMKNRSEVTTPLTLDFSS